MKASFPHPAPQLLRPSRESRGPKTLALETSAPASSRPRGSGGLRTGASRAARPHSPARRGSRCSKSTRTWCPDSFAALKVLAQAARGLSRCSARALAGAIFYPPKLRSHCCSRALFLHEAAGALVPPERAPSLARTQLPCSGISWMGALTHLWCPTPSLFAAATQRRAGYQCHGTVTIKRDSSVRGPLHRLKHTPF